MASPRRIALFGGTFDPVHDGHLEIASKAVAELSLDTLVFVPCRQSPHKDSLPGASNADRLEMLNRATEQHPWASIDDSELKKPPPSYTWETVRAFREEFPEPNELYLLIGEDQWSKLPSWKNYHYLADTVQFIVVGREKQPLSRPGCHAHFIKGNHPASSSEIRQQLHSGQQADWLPRPVEAFILEKGLYSALP